MYAIITAAHITPKWYCFIILGPFFFIRSKAVDSESTQTGGQLNQVAQSSFWTTQPIIHCKRNGKLGSLIQPKQKLLNLRDQQCLRGIPTYKGALDIGEITILLLIEGGAKGRQPYVFQWVVKKMKKKMIFVFSNTKNTTTASI